MTKHYMHGWSGDVATEQEWRNDFESTDIENWFGLPAEECKDLHWLDDVDLHEVQQVDGEWVEV